MKALYIETKLSKVIALKAAQVFWRYAALGPLSPFRCAETPEPEIPNPRWLKVRNKSCGLCGTDIHFMFMEMDPRCFSAAVPGITRKFLGHELVGEVIEAGAEVRGFAVGDRVALRIDWPSCFQLEIDPPCRQCAIGSYMLCENLGAKRLPVENPGGGFSPYMVMHQTQPYKIPDALSDDAALLIEPLASAVHGVLKARPQPDEKALVIGGGTLGLLSVAALRALAPDVQVACLVRYAFQERVARKLGATIIREGADLYRRVAETAGARHVTGYFGNEILLGGFNVVYDTVGNDQSLHDALRWTKGGGRVVLVGINFRPGRFDYSPIWSQEVALIGINCHATEADGRTSFDIAADLLLADCLSPTDIITHRFPVEQYKQAVKTFLSKRTSEAIKIILDVARP
jgi:2-desacetyl-2-hydroxyethyl bacteriochlorophyllide A dehydrogenase